MVFLQDVTHLREVVSEVNKTQGLYHSWTGDQIQNLQTAVSHLTQRVSSMEQGSPQTTPHSVSNGIDGVMGIFTMNKYSVI